MLPASFQEKFARLKADYMAQLPARLAQLRGQLAACRADPQDTAALEAFHRALHTMAGTAGSFGLGALGAQARSIEHVLDPLLGRDARSAADFDGLDAALDALEAEAPRG